MTTEPTRPDDLLAPVDFIAVEFPDGMLTAEGFDRLLDLAQRRVIQVLDVEFVAKGADGVRVVPLSDVPVRVGDDVSAWSGSSSGLLDADDVGLIGAAMSEGSVVAVIVFENVWVLDVVAGWSRSGARMILDGAIPAGDLLDALDAQEAE